MHIMCTLKVKENSIEAAPSFMLRYTNYNTKQDLHKLHL